jgi:hypothetical protein
MQAERKRITFRYRRGEVIGIAGRPDRWIVGPRHYDERDIMPPLITYDLDHERTGVREERVAEADIIAPPRPHNLQGGRHAQMGHDFTL